MASARSIIARDDTLLGACYALGEDFGFNPTYLRVLIALALFLSPAAAVAGYLALAALVMFSRWIAPDPAPVEEEAGTTAAAPDLFEAQEELPLAA